MTSVVIDSNEFLGKTLGSCTLERLIGRGGMGAVYLAQQSRPRRAVAIKVLMPGMALLEGEQRSEFLTRFRREADAIAALDHVNIMPIYEYGEEGQIAYLVMPFVTGGTLRDTLEKQGKLSLDEALPIIEQAAAALNYAHERGIIHRDLKPGNILFHSDGRVLLADFGLAKMIKGTNKLEAETMTALTTAGMVIGTPEYLSPEQANAARVDQRTDIYSLGIVLYQMLSGRLPFTGATPVAIAIKHMMEKPPSISQLNPAIPPRVEAVIMKAIAKDPDARYNSADELAAAFHQAVNEIYIARNRVVLQSQKQPQPPLAATSFSTEPVELAVRPSVPPQGQGAPTIQPPASASEPELVQVSLSNEATTEMPPTRESIGEPQIRTVPTTPAPYPDPTPGGGGKRPRLKLIVTVGIVIVLVAGLVPLLLHGISQTSSATNQNTGTIQTRSTPPGSATNPPIQGQVSTPTATNTPSPTALNLPAPKVNVGTLLYGTLQPGSCDSQGGTWTSVGDNQMSCSPDGTLLTTNNDITQHIGGIFLDKLPGGQQIPNDYIVQFQVQIKSGEGFGIFGHTNVAHTNGMAMRLQGSGYLDGYGYDSQNGATQLFSGTSTPPLNGLTTITAVVQGQQLTLYADGNQLGYGINPNVSSGTFGFGTSNDAQVLLKNVALYAMP